jgi:hypothetical protein
VQCNLTLNKPYMAFNHVKTLQERLPGDHALQKVLAHTQAKCRMWEQALKSCAHCKGK